MNTFFYAAASTACCSPCNYPTCSRRCHAMLDALPELQNLKILPGGSKFKTPLSMELRSGDILILYAADREEIDALVSIRDYLETFRVILIVGTDELLEYGRHHHLNPRYTTGIGKNFDTLDTILGRMIKGPRHAHEMNQAQQEKSYA